jgi:hypothetical protein
LDANSNGALDSGEFATAQTVSFKKYSDVSSVVTLTQPLEGDTSVTATATFTGLNADQLVASESRVVFTVGGAVTTSVEATSGKYTVTGLAALTTSATVSATVQYRVDTIGSADTKTVTNRTIASITSSAVAGNNAKNTAAGAVETRLNTEFALQAVVKDAATTPAAVAGAVVTAAVTSGVTLSSTISITVNGTTYTSSGTLPGALAVGTSDAAGKVTFNVKTTGFATGDTFTVNLSSQNRAAGVVTVTNNVANYTVTNDGTSNLKAALGASYTLGYSVKDQWSVLTTVADRLKITAGADPVFVNLSGGKASVTFTAPTASATVSVVNNELQVQDTSTLNWSARSGVSFGAIAATVSVLATNTADAFDGTAVLVSVSASISRVDAAGELTNGVTLSGSVNNAGAVVTISGAGLKFHDMKAGSDVIATGSIMAVTDGSGDFSVHVYSHTAGTATVTYTVGTATKSTVVTTAAAAYNTGKVIAITTNAVNGYSAPGSTFRATVTLVDEYGNPVAADNTTASFGVSITGPGFVGTLPTKTGADGSAAFSVLLGSADSGNIVVTATYDADGATTTVAAISATTTVVVGTAAVVQKVNVGSFKGYVALYAKGYAGQKFSAIVAGKWIVVESLDSGFERIVRFTGAGYDIDVKIYIDGMQVGSTFMVTTK